MLTWINKSDKKVFASSDYLTTSASTKVNQPNKLKALCAFTLH